MASIIAMAGGALLGSALGMAIEGASATDVVAKANDVSTAISVANTCCWDLPWGLRYQSETVLPMALYLFLYWV